jgi:hypothetical protein
VISILLAATSFQIGTAITITNNLPPAVMMLMRFLMAALMFAPYLMLRNTLYFPTPKKMLGYIVLSITLGTDPFEMALLTRIVMVIMAMFIIQHEAEANSRA